MGVFVRTLRVIDKATTALGVLCGLAALFLWVHAILQWGDAMAMAWALTGSVVALVAIGLSAGMSRLRARGE